MNHYPTAKRFKIFLIIIISFLGHSGFSQNVVISKQIEDLILGSGTLEKSFTGIAVYDPAEHEMLFSYNADRFFTPASNVKLFSMWAGLLMIKDSIPAMKYRIKNDTLYFTGTGDPTFLHPEFSFQPVFEFLKNSEYPLVYCERDTEGERFGPGWAWEDYKYYFSPERSSFPIYGNSVWLNKDASDSAITIFPERFIDDIIFIPVDTLKKYDLTREELFNLFTVTYNPGKRIKNESIPFMYSRDMFVKLLEDTLHSDINICRHLPGGPLVTMYSQPLDSVLERMMWESDNLFAEQMLLMCAQQKFDSLSSMMTINYLLDSIPELKSKVYLVDGSGLSRYDLLTPTAFIRILEYIYRHIEEDRLLHLLPGPGKKGTLKRFFPSLKGKLYAKTGSMSHVYNLSGVIITNSGKKLLFSIMNNNFTVRNGTLRREITKILTKITEYQ